MPLVTGQILNKRYRVVKLLGQSGFGAVYRAWDTNLKGSCVVKEVLDTSTVGQQHFSQEASSLFKLRHFNLPRVYDAFSIARLGQYLVMDYVEGEDLRQMMERTPGSLPEAMVLPWIAQVCDALSYLHSQNPPIIHRDVQPANIRINPQGSTTTQTEFGRTQRAMLVNFGIAAGTLAAAPGYSPPEQYGRGVVDAQSDLFALGATLYHLLTGQKPPASLDILSGEVPPPPQVKQLNPNVSPGVSTALEHAMHIDRNARFLSVAEFKNALQRGVGAAVHPVVNPANQATAVQVLIPQQKIVVSNPPSRPMSWGIALGVLALVLLVVCLASLVLGGKAILDNTVGSSSTKTAQFIAVLTTETPSATALPPTSTATSVPSTATATSAATPLPSPTSTQSLAPILLTEWSLTNFYKISSGCYISTAACWISQDQGANTSMEMISSKAIYIDTTWSSPFLVFWNRYDIKKTAFLSIQVDSKWQKLKVYSTGSTNWHQAFIDLHEYKGKNISLQFSLQGSKSSETQFSSGLSASTWFLQALQIVPNYSPPKQ
jgi:serine/threonine protein kinase